MRALVGILLLVATGCAPALGPSAPPPAPAAQVANQSCADRCLLDLSVPYPACLRSCPGASPRPPGGCRDSSSSYVRCDVLAQRRQEEQARQQLAANLDTIAATLQLVDDIATLTDAVR